VPSRRSVAASAMSPPIRAVQEEYPIPELNKTVHAQIAWPAKFNLNADPDPMAAGNRRSA